MPYVVQAVVSYLFSTPAIITISFCFIRICTCSSTPVSPSRRYWCWTWESSAKFPSVPKWMPIPIDYFSQGLPPSWFSLHFWKRCMPTWPYELPSLMLLSVPSDLHCWSPLSGIFITGWCICRTFAHRVSYTFTFPGSPMPASPLVFSTSPSRARADSP